jgi:hypothetical protein
MSLYSIAVILKNKVLEAVTGSASPKARRPTKI